MNGPQKRFLFIGLVVAGVLVCVSWLANALTANLLRQAVPGAQFNHVQLNPLNRMLHIYGIRYVSGGVSVEVSRLDVGVDMFSLLGGSFDISHLTIDKPSISIAIDKPWGGGQDIELPSLHEVQINDGTLIFQRGDRPLAKQLHVSLTSERDIESRNSWQTQAVLGMAGGTARVKGVIDAEGATFNVTATDIPLSELLLQQDRAAITLLQGKAAAELKIKAAFLSPSLTVDGHVRGSDIVAKMSGQPEKQKIGSVYIEGVVDLLKDVWKLRTVDVHDPQLRLYRSRQTVQIPVNRSRQVSIEKLVAHNTAITLLRHSQVGLIELPLRKIKLSARRMQEKSLIPKSLSISGLLPGGAFAARLRNGGITGRLKGLDMKYLDRLSLAITNHRIHHGSADAELSGSLQGRNLDVTVDMDIKDFVIGPPIPMGASDELLPMRAAVASLTSMDGHTHFPVHITGDYASPEISITDAVHQAVGNAVLSSLGLPVSMLISAFSDIKAAKHKVIGFRDAALRYSDAGQRTVRHLTHALRQQLELRLELRGCAAPGRDGDQASAKRYKELAAQRARNVRRTLIRRGVSPARISIVYPMLWEPSPHLGGLGPRVEASLLSF